MSDEGRFSTNERQREIGRRKERNRGRKKMRVMTSSQKKGMEREESKEEEMLDRSVTWSEESRVDG